MRYLSFYKMKTRKKKIEIEESNNRKRSFVSEASNCFSLINIVKCRYFLSFMALNKLFLVSLNSLKLGVWQMLLYSTCVELINQTSSFRPFNDTRKSYVEPYTNKFWSSRIFGDFTCKNLLATKIIRWLQFIIITAQYPML